MFTHVSTEHIISVHSANVDTLYIHKNNSCTCRTSVYILVYIRLSVLVWNVHVRAYGIFSCRYHAHVYTCTYMFVYMYACTNIYVQTISRLYKTVHISGACAAVFVHEGDPKNRAGRQMNSLPVRNANPSAPKSKRCALWLPSCSQAHFEGTASAGKVQEWWTCSKNPETLWLGMDNWPMPIQSTKGSTEWLINCWSVLTVQGIPKWSKHIGLFNQPISLCRTVRAGGFTTHAEMHVPGHWRRWSTTITAANYEQAEKHIAAKTKKTSNNSEAQQ